MPRDNTSLPSEFYVASILWRLGYEVTITMGQTKEIDIFAKKDIEKWDNKSCDVRISKLEHYLDRWDLSSISA